MEKTIYCKPDIKWELLKCDITGCAQDCAQNKAKEERCNMNQKYNQLGCLQCELEVVPQNLPDVLNNYNNLKDKIEFKIAKKTQWGYFS